ncbi:ATP12 family chaperone protein [Hyphomonas johnsonii]|uniref:ATP12 ATPase n=1 Tax=Hyphomonas johnsonii MHS-2 TaxID=1280950 RepID=A0A059FTC8_9PROT|nr:ATP12 family protein [Hyphomonas johnsonii]KCZ93924.1 ATP12 ATPase [Hyphomonas johnsonii MHS-2]
MTNSPPTPTPKRFYKQAAAERLDDGWTVALDGRTIKTPARAALLIPSERLARAIAAEWQAQGDKIDLAAMHLTRLANVAIDRTDEVRDEMADELARYCETDLLCHIAETPPELAESEEEHWAPVRDWAGDTLGVNLVPVIGIVASPQPDASLDAARDHALGLDAFRLTGLVYAAGLFGSALLALAVEQGAISAEDAYEVSRIDEAWQAEHWGEDDEAKAATEARRAEAKALGVWFRALQD